MSIKAQLEALIYAAEEPITLDQMTALLKDDLLALKQAAQNDADSASASEPHPEHAEEHLGAVENGATAPGTAPEDDTAAILAKKSKGKEKEKSEKAELRALLRPFLQELMADFNGEDHGIEIRQVAGGYRMSTKPEHHDLVRAFSKSLKPPIR